MLVSHFAPPCLDEELVSSLIALPGDVRAEADGEETTTTEEDSDFDEDDFDDDFDDDFEEEEDFEDDLPDELDEDDLKHV